MGAKSASSLTKDSYQELSSGVEGPLPALAATLLSGAFSRCRIRVAEKARPAVLSFGVAQRFTAAIQAHSWRLEPLRECIGSQRPHNR